MGAEGVSIAFPRSGIATVLLKSFLVFVLVSVSVKISHKALFTLSRNE